MHFLSTLLPLLPLLSLPTSFAQTIKNTTREFNLKTVVCPNQPGKSAFNNLWLDVYHTGAGLNDVTLTPQRSSTIKGFLNATGTVANGRRFYNMVFDFGSAFPWGLVMNLNAVAYAAWQPSEINAGAVGNDTSVNGFFINKQGLRWTTSPSNPGGSEDAFGGWLVCNWWHLEPQLFSVIARYQGFKVPAGCALVELQPVYL